MKNSLGKDQSTEMLRLAEYIQRQLSRGIRDFQPKLVAAALGISEAEALLLLVLLQKRGLVRVKYVLRCPNSDVPVRIVYDLASLRNEEDECPECGEVHAPSESKVTVLFEYVGQEPLIGHAA